jgi:hypothetical protein
MIAHAAHATPALSRARWNRPAPLPAVADSSPDSDYLRRWITAQASRHADLLQTIAAAPRPVRPVGR